LVVTLGNGRDAPIAVIGQALVNRLLTTLPGHEQPVQVIPEAHSRIQTYNFTVAQLMRLVTNDRFKPPLH
jgi:hypothetical protein